MADCPTPTAQDSVLPPPGSGTRARSTGLAAPQVEALASDLARAYAELESLRAQLAAEREARAEADVRAGQLLDVVQDQARALAQVLAARAPAPVAGGSVHPSPAPDVHQHVHRTEVDVSTDVHPSPVDMKGGRGEAAAAKPEAELKREKWRNDKRRQRKKKPAAAVAREMSTSDTSTTSTADVHLGHVHRVDTSAAAPAKPKWMEETTPSPDKAFFARFQDARCARHRGAVPEPRPPPGWAAWYEEALAAVGGDEGRLWGACLAYLEDDWGRTRQPVCPARAFIAPEVWPRHVPGQGEPVVEQRRGAHSVGGGTMPEPQPLPDTPAGRVWGQVLEAARALQPYNGASLAACTTPVGLVDGVLTVECLDRFNRDWVEEQWSRWLGDNADRFGLCELRFTAPELEQGVDP
ncbi:hypothetical protein [Myxococcus sp. AS-1-15]|uniref:hypothetical protein n=1 Tax=Myxococcus sp. AS-1-15 TaxID=2874600 RepID=UPI001CC08E91|nr:hypothetical protein [Myxococcus sp. AS-1-15]MBZ4400398.1 hypothetical protein [Myxococcus sp. AS-1-15]